MTTDPHVNDERSVWKGCWICGHLNDHYGRPHATATGDGLTRYDIVDYMNQGGYAWRPGV